MNRDLEACFDKWEASFDALYRYLLDTASGVTEPATASSGMTELVIASAGLAAPSTTVLSIDATVTAVATDVSSSTAKAPEVLQVVHDASPDCIETAPATCSTDCVAQTSPVFTAAAASGGTFDDEANGWCACSKPRPIPWPSWLRTASAPATAPTTPTASNRCSTYCATAAIFLEPAVDLNNNEVEQQKHGTIWEPRPAWPPPVQIKSSALCSFSGSSVGAVQVISVFPCELLYHQAQTLSRPHVEKMLCAKDGLLWGSKNKTGLNPEDMLLVVNNIIALYSSFPRCTCMRMEKSKRNGKLIQWLANDLCGLNISTIQSIQDVDTLISWVLMNLDGEANQRKKSQCDPGSSMLALCSFEKRWTTPLLVSADQSVFPDSLPLKVCWSSAPPSFLMEIFSPKGIFSPEGSGSFAVQLAIETVLVCNDDEGFLAYMLSDKLLQHDNVQWKSWPRPLSLFEYYQEGVPFTSLMVQSWLGPSARPQSYAQALSNKFLVSVKLLAHPSVHRLYKLLLLGYQGCGDSRCLLWASEQERHVFDTAAGQPKSRWLSGLTQVDTEFEKGVHPSGEVITLNSKTTLAAPDSRMPQYTRSNRPLTEVKPPDGTHVLLLYHHSNLGLVIPDVLVTWQHFSMGKITGLSSNEISSHADPMSSVDRLLLWRYNSFSNWTCFGVGWFNGILLQDCLLSWFIGHITQCGFELLQWKIAWSRQWECSEIAAWSVFATSFRPTETCSFLDDMKRNNGMRSSHILMLAFPEVPTIIVVGLCSRFGITIGFTWSSQLMENKKLNVGTSLSCLNGGLTCTSSVNIAGQTLLMPPKLRLPAQVLHRAISVTDSSSPSHVIDVLPNFCGKQHRIGHLLQWKHIKLIWFFPENGAWIQSELNNKDISIHDANTSIAARIPYTTKKMDLCMAARELLINQHQGYGWISSGFVLRYRGGATLLADQCADEDGMLTRKQYRALMQRIEAPWDPGGLFVTSATSAWGQAAFLGGRDVRTLSYLYRTGLGFGANTRASPGGHQPGTTRCYISAPGGTNRPSGEDQDMALAAASPPTSALLPRSLFLLLPF